MADASNPSASTFLSGLVELNQQDVENTIKAYLFSLGKKILRGAIEDQQQYTSQIANDLVESAKITDKTKREAVQAELIHQLPMVAEKMRLRANNEMWDVWTEGVKVGLAIVDRLITKGLMLTAP